MNKDLLNKPKIVFIIEHCDYKGYYPFERAATLTSELKSYADLFIFLKNPNQQSITYFTENKQTPVLFEQFKQLAKTIRNLEVDLIVYDGPDSSIEQIEMIRPFCETLVHLDDLGDGAKRADFIFNVLYEDDAEATTSHEMNGTHFFISNPTLIEVRNERLKKDVTLQDSIPHVAIYFEDGDPNNLTYRTLRHLNQLQIPLKISVILDDDYMHPAEDLTIMTLSRKNSMIVRGKLGISNALIHADCLICNSLYTPYKAAFIGIPCITTAQHERELSYSFPQEKYGFIHIGLGRKMKQSIIQNALMELILHEHLRKKAVQRQRHLNLEKNNSYMTSLLLDIVHHRHSFS